MGDGRWSERERERREGGGWVGVGGWGEAHSGRCEAEGVVAGQLLRSDRVPALPVQLVKIKMASDDTDIWM